MYTNFTIYPNLVKLTTMIRSLDQKFALVTGASRGIGAAIALQLATDGYDIFLVYHQNLVKANIVAKQIRNLGRLVWIIQADVTKEEDRQKIFNQISKHTTHLDLLVNNAGFDFPLLIENYPLSKIESVISIILTSKISLTNYP
jgi:3-oxoacyl-[acyl-carrier protein] reductase